MVLRYNFFFAFCPENMDNAFYVQWKKCKDIECGSVTNWIVNLFGKLSLENTKTCIQFLLKLDLKNHGKTKYGSSRLPAKTRRINSRSLSSLSSWSDRGDTAGLTGINSPICEKEIHLDWHILGGKSNTNKIMKCMGDKITYACAEPARAHQHSKLSIPSNARLGIVYEFAALHQFRYQRWPPKSDHVMGKVIEQSPNCRVQVYN